MSSPSSAYTIPPKYSKVDLNKPPSYTEKPKINPSAPVFTKPKINPPVSAMSKYGPNYNSPIININYGPGKNTSYSTSAPVNYTNSSTSAPVSKLKQTEKFIAEEQEKKFKTELAAAKEISSSKAKANTAKYILIGLFSLLIIGFIPLYLYVIHPQAGKDLDAGSNSSAEWSESSGDSAKSSKSN